MRPGTKLTRDRSAGLTLGLVILTVVLLLSLLGCASRSTRLTPLLPDNRGDSLTALASESVSRQVTNQDPLEVCAVVPEEDLKEMRGCLGVYYFDFTFDINMKASPEVSVKTNFTAAVPDGAPAPQFNGTTAAFRDDNVFYVAGPTGNGMMSEVIVTGRDNIVFANTNFNIRMPDTTILSPAINILPAGSLTGIGRHF